MERGHQTRPGLLCQSAWPALTNRCLEVRRSRFNQDSALNERRNISNVPSAILTSSVPLLLLPGREPKLKRRFPHIALYETERGEDMWSAGVDADKTGVEEKSAAADSGDV